MTEPVLAMFGLPGGMEWVVIGLLGLLIFGGRLPQVMRSVGRSIVEFKRGLRDVKDEIETGESSNGRILPDHTPSAKTEGSTPTDQDKQ